MVRPRIKSSPSRSGSSQDVVERRQKNPGYPLRSGVAFSMGYGVGSRVCFRAGKCLKIWQRDAETGVSTSLRCGIFDGLGLDSRASFEPETAEISGTDGRQKTRVSTSLRCHFNLCQSPVVQSRSHQDAEVTKKLTRTGAQSRVGGKVEPKVHKTTAWLNSSCFSRLSQAF